MVVCVCACKTVCTSQSFRNHLRENIDEILPHCATSHYEFVSFQFAKAVTTLACDVSIGFNTVPCNRSHPCGKGCVNGALLRLLLQQRMKSTYTNYLASKQESTRMLCCFCAKHRSNHPSHALHTAWKLSIGFVNFEHGDHVQPTRKCKHKQNL